MITSVFICIQKEKTAHRKVFHKFLFGIRNPNNKCEGRPTRPPKKVTQLFILV